MFKLRRIGPLSIGANIICMVVFLTGIVSINNDAYAKTVQKAQDNVWVEITPNTEEKITADIDIGPYTGNVQRKVKGKWVPPNGQGSERVVVISKITPNGEIAKPILQKSSGLANVDQAVLAAVQKAAPFAPLPNGLHKDVGVKFIFEHNVIEHGKFKRF